MGEHCCIGKDCLICSLVRERDEAFALLEREQAKVVALFTLARARAKRIEMQRARDTFVGAVEVASDELRAIEVLVSLGVPREALS